ncbi:MAG TPA: TlpA disulfide reductase family protein [Usitatibacter sp.]|nr:TlpA disulfide reductase family protein [Usitatibacter sp.]
MGETRPQRFVFAAVGVAALLAGTAMWLATAPAPTRLGASNISSSALFAAGFHDLQGASHSLGEFEGKVVVLNFWATWCPPCREEMPALSRLQAAWAPRKVQFVGLSSEDPLRVSQFARQLGVSYPLWVGGSEVEDLSRRLGNTAGVLPHTVILDPAGRVMVSKVGTYSEAALDTVLHNVALQLHLNSEKKR